MSAFPIQVRVQEYMLHSRYALTSEVRRQMLYADAPMETIHEFEIRSSHAGDDFLAIANEFVEVILP